LIKGFCIPAATVVSMDGRLWHVTDLYQASGLIAIVTMCFIVLPSGFHKSSRAQPRAEQLMLCRGVTFFIGIRK
jgi:hypothetical protein